MPYSGSQEDGFDIATSLGTNGALTAINFTGNTYVNSYSADTPDSTTSENTLILTEVDASTPFSFVSVDLDADGGGTPEQVFVRGIRNSVLVGEDTFSPAAPAGFTTFSALSLAGLAIDTLEIVLVSFDGDGGTSGGWTVNADNILLDSGPTVPLPAPLALLAPGLLGLLILRRRRAA